MLTDLSVTPIADTIWRLSTQRRSGDLQVRSGRVSKTLFFDHGRLVFAASNLKKDRLGEALIALGDITDADFRRASALMKEGDRRRRFGEALVHAGVLDKQGVGRSVARQVRRIVLSIFEFSEGAASFEDRRCSIPLDYMVSLSVHRLLYDGIKAMKGDELVLAGLGELDRWVRLAEVPSFPFDPEECSEEEVQILEQCRRKATLRRLAWAPGGLAFPKLRATYALLASGVIEDAKIPEGQTAPQPIIQMETGTFLLSALGRRPDPTTRQAIRQEVDEELQRSSRLDRETWLKVSRTAPRAELAKALEGKMERYHALLDAVGEDHELKTDIELILGRASSMLRLTRQPPPSEVLAPDDAPAPRGAAPPAKPTKEVEKEPAAAAPAAPAVPAGFKPTPDMERLLSEGHVQMTIADYAAAVKTYADLVQLGPRVATFRARLAIAMACYPRTTKHAEREFLEALRLEPDNADIHFQFGLYYKAMKQRPRAVAELRTAVRLNPRHKLARKELEALSPKDSALTSLKKLFK